MVRIYDLARNCRKELRFFTMPNKVISPEISNLFSIVKNPRSFLQFLTGRSILVLFEGSSKGVNEKGFWVAMESPLIVDGDEPSFNKTSSPIRVTYFDKKSKKAIKQFAYQLEHITKPSKGKINLNGVTSILEYRENHFFIIERTYQSGYGNYGNSN